MISATGYLPIRYLRWQWLHTGLVKQALKNSLVSTRLFSFNFAVLIGTAGLKQPDSLFDYTAAAGFYSIANNSTSNISVASGPITGPLPFGP